MSHLCCTLKHVCLCIQQTSFQHQGVESVVVLLAVVAAHGSDELLHAVLGAVMAGRARLVHQRVLLLARPHAHAGALTSHSTNPHVITCQEVAVATCSRNCCVM